VNRASITNAAHQGSGRQSALASHCHQLCEWWPVTVTTTRR